MTEDFLIRNCAPTLAGIKTANLFACPYKSKSEITEALCRFNRILSQKGLRVLPLRYSGKKALIYLSVAAHQQPENAKYARALKEAERAQQAKRRGLSGLLRRR